MLQEDINVREYLRKKLAHASVGRITIERPSKNARFTIYTSRPGIVIGKKPFLRSTKFKINREIRPLPSKKGCIETNL